MNPDARRSPVPKSCICSATLLKNQAGYENWYLLMDVMSVMDDAVKYLSDLREYLKKDWDK